MSLNVGDPAPQFAVLSAIDGKVEEVTRDSLLDHHSGLVLTSYPLDFTGGCRNQLSQFRDAYEDFSDLHIQIASVSVDSPYSHVVWAEQLDIPYPMLSDFNRELLPAYDAINPEPGRLKDVARRTAFLIDAQGTIAYAWYPSADAKFPPIDILLKESRLVAQASLSR